MSENTLQKTTREKVTQIFEYLLAMKNIDRKVSRDIADYEKVWWEKEFPQHIGCYLGGSGNHSEAWLEVHKQIVPAVPNLPTSLRDWIEKWDDPDRSPSPKSRIANGVNEVGEPVYKRFEDDQELVRQFTSWLSNVWTPWSEQASIKQNIQQLYMELFALHQRFQREGDTIELVWGHGLLQWVTSGTVIRRPLLTTRVELEFDAKKGVFALVPTSKGTLMETDMLNNIAIPNGGRIQEIRRELEEMDLDPRNETLLEPLLREIIQTISPEGQYVKNGDHTKLSVPSITHSPVLVLRKSGENLWFDELTDVIGKIKDGGSIPGILNDLITSESTVSEQHLAPSDPSWNPVGEELLFPLPANKEQKLIARKLASHHGVVVQGPPGTGKSHTIANLISHLLAHGKRVLVTSQKERALQVLRHKIPEEIRALCVSVLGGDSRSIKELEDSVREIAQSLDRLQPDILQQQVKQHQQELYEVRKRIANLNYRINSAAELENLPILVAGKEWTPLEMSQWLSEHKQHNWLPDQVKMSQDFPLSEKEFQSFIELLNRLSTQDIQASQHNRPVTRDLPTPTEFERNVQKVRKLKNLHDQSVSHLRGWKVEKQLTFSVEDLLSQVQASREELRELNAAWLMTILEDSVAGGHRRTQWEEFVRDLSERMKKLQDLDRDLVEAEVQISSDAPPEQLIEDLQELHRRLLDKKGLGWFFQNVTGRKLAYLVNDCKVNHRSVRSAEDTALLLKHVVRQDLVRKTVLKWNRTMEEIGGERLESGTNRLVIYVGNLLQQIKSLLDWPTRVIQPLQKSIASFGVPDAPRWTDAAWFEIIAKGVEAWLHRKDWEQAQRFFTTYADIMAKGKDAPESHPAWGSLFTACQSYDAVLWETVYRELQRLESLEEDVRAYHSYCGRLQTCSPLWVQELIQAAERGDHLQMPSDWEQAWRWSQWNGLLNELAEKTDIEKMEEELQMEKGAEAHLIEKVVAASTWLAQLKRVTRQQKQSLQAWLKAVKNIGKGTGKYANVYRKEANQEMKTCRGAIPVWIMPVQKVIENIEYTNEQFDVVIVDESSQSDLYALSVFLRAKKVVVVGDEHQISPENVGVEIEKVHGLIDTHLVGIPHRKTYDTKTSLYDLANRVLDGKIVLLEHFRCVPEIIQFSNDLMYGGKIDPLRLPLAHEMLTPPVKAIRVTDGFRMEGTRKVVNLPEAEAIVNQILHCCKDSKYAGKTMGVISLQGPDQAKEIENLLREQLGEEEMINRRLIVGDSYSFQGDERDVIFLSMVAANNVGIGALTKNSDYQRFNVAASRARDQMFLFHSVDPKDLNSNCARYRLLQYCLDPRRVQRELEDVERLFESPFERDVFQQIVARGYRVVPQVKVGSVGKRIDLVVEGMRSRLAVECDGDRWHGLDKWEEDMERQRILERVGWTFWRVRGSAFYRDPSKAMESLWKKLDEMGIEPHKVG